MMYRIVKLDGSAIELPHNPLHTNQTFEPGDQVICPQGRVIAHYTTFDTAERPAEG